MPTVAAVSKGLATRGDGGVSLDEAFAALFYSENFLIVPKELTGQPWDFEAFRVFWSLSVEEHFYLFFR